jgi:hypothetical protein
MYFRGADEAVCELFHYYPAALLFNAFGCV